MIAWISRERTRHGGISSILVSIASIALGTAYYAVLVAVPFPPDWLRIVPFAWLVVAATGMCLAIEALRAQRQVGRPIIGLISGLVSLGVASIFMLAALIGD